MNDEEAIIRIQERERIIDIINNWFLGKRKGKAGEWLFCKKGILSYSEIKKIKKIIRNS